MEKYIISVLFIFLIATLSVFVNKYREDPDESQKTKLYVLSVLLGVTILSGGYYIADEFYFQPQNRKELLRKFLQLSPEDVNL